MIRQRTVFAGFMILLSLGILWSCKKDKSPVGPTDGNEVPQGMAHITGSVHDASGAPLSGVALHLVYNLGTSTASEFHPMVPSTVSFYDLDQVLTTTHGGTTPLPDGVMVKLFWDRDGDGPDDQDPPPPLCNHPPTCDDGPVFTVNLNEFPINGVEVELGPGLFFMDPAFVTIGDVLTPNRFYARIYCADGNVLYESQVVTVPPGPSEQELNFTGYDCTGSPVIPDWTFDQCYPNPAADTLNIAFGLQQSARGVVTLRWPDNRFSETLTDSTYGSGAHLLKILLGNRPNGLYTVRYSADIYQNQHTVLKNVRDYDLLRGTEETVLTDDAGAFSLDAAAGEAIGLRSSDGTDQGTAVLTRLTIVAIRTGYQISDSTFDIASGESYDISFVLLPE